MQDKNLKAQMEDAARRALKNREELLLSTLRLLLTAIHNREIEKRSSFARATEDKLLSVDLSDEEVLLVIRSEAKKRKDAIAEFIRANRLEATQKEAAELAVLEKYLPSELSEEEIEKLIQPLAERRAMSDFGAVMGAAMKAVSGRASGDRVSAAVKRMLTGTKA
ncbi:MAG: GatB/YqeY domain-containing protein [Candidatus Sungbacteria bacterium]|nr:GatB/YqeY domain-containing protein [Candidatus Sungbacteria bacterium]